ncbi:MAG: D-lyxose/D-mannose family sugar isomerase [Blautia marasmi]
MTLEPGQSITLLPGQYHRWEGEKERGKVMLFEVSTTNDDMTDNRFYEAKEVPILWKMKHLNILYLMIIKSMYP